MPVIGSVDELLARASWRSEVRPGDGKAGARYERVLVDGERYFLKRLSPAIGLDHAGHRRPRPPALPDLAGRDHGPLPGCIDHTVVAMQISGAGDDAVLTMVMRDVAAFLVPEGDTVVPAASTPASSTHLADLSRAFWGWRDDIGLTTMAAADAVLRARQHRRRAAGRRCPGADRRC